MKSSKLHFLLKVLGEPLPQKNLKYNKLKVGVIIHPPRRVVEDGEINLLMMMDGLTFHKVVEIGDLDQVVAITALLIDTETMMLTKVIEDVTGMIITVTTIGPLTGITIMVIGILDNSITTIMIVIIAQE